VEDYPLLQLNRIIEFNKSQYRLLKLPLNGVIWIDVKRDNAFPEFVDSQSVIDNIYDELAFYVDDPFNDFINNSKFASPKARDKRDENWKIIEGIVTDSSHYSKKGRGKLVKQASQKFTSPENKIYRLLRRYWQRGQTRNALIPDYANMGSLGSIRVNVRKKIGRPRIVSLGQGTIVTEDIRSLIVRAIERYYLKDKHVPWKKIEVEVNRAFAKFYPQIKFEDYPTLTQVKHIFSKQFLKMDVAQKRFTAIDYDNNIKPITSTATSQVSGPGERFEIDATIIDLYLVSSQDREKIVGRPTFFVVVDVFSRLIVGYYLTFEPASYVTAMMALANCLEDKVTLCKNVGIEIEEDDWPIAGLPEIVLADKGELQTHQADSLVNNYNIELENARARKGSAKGIVESKFNHLQASFVKYVPGAVEVETVKKRGGKDYRLDAVLNIEEMNKIIIKLIVDHNRSNVMEHYDPDSEIPVDLPLIPSTLWNWGIKNRSGKLKYAKLDDFKISVLPEEQARVSKLGVNFRGLYYTCSEIIEAGWLLRGDASTTRSSKLRVKFDPRTTNNIYIINSEEQVSVWVASLTDRSRDMNNLTFYEAKQKSFIRKLTQNESKLTTKQADVEFDDFLTDIVKQANSEKPKKSASSSAAKVKSIKKNKLDAVSEERKKRSTGSNSDDVKNHEEADVLPFKKKSDFSYPDLEDE
jgi:hypothetical protein